jgi:carbonic anhydrase/acetyltransferase-like protein (isoleucine patch superfamily)
VILTHQGKTPSIDAAAQVAPTATIAGDVRLGPGCRVGFGASLVSEGAPLVLGTNVIVMENAVVRATATHATTIGDHVVIGPLAHVVGATIEDEVFVATGAAIFHGARIGRGAEVRIHGVVHIRTELPAGATVPIGWVAVGTPAQILPPDQHDAIWALQRPLDFPGFVYGVDREGPAPMVAIARALAAKLRY